MVSLLQSVVGPYQQGIPNIAGGPVNQSNPIRAARAAQLALLFGALLLSSCTLVNPYVRSKLLDCDSEAACSGSSSTYAGGAEQAIAAAEDQRKKYLAAAGYQYGFNSVMGAGVIGLSADAIYKGVASGSKSPNLPLTAIAAGAAGLYGLDVWFHNKPAESAYIVGFQAITCTLLRSRAILMTTQELQGAGGFDKDIQTFETQLAKVDDTLSRLQIAWDLGDEASDVDPVETVDSRRETGNVIKSLARARKLLLTARAYEKEIESSGRTIRGQVDLIVANVSGQVAPAEPNITGLKGLLGVFADPSKGVADLQAVTLDSSGMAPNSQSPPAGTPSSKPNSKSDKALAALVGAPGPALTVSDGYVYRSKLRQELLIEVSELYADGRKLNSVLASAQNFYESTRRISACALPGATAPLQISPATVSDPVSAGSVLKFNISGGVGIPDVVLTGSTGSSADSKTPDLALTVNGNSLVAAVTILPGASGTLTLLASDKGTPAQQAKVTLDVESSAPTTKPAFKAVPGDGSAQLTFATPTTKGGTLSGYTVTVGQGSATPTTLKISSPEQGMKSTGSTTITAMISAETPASVTITLTGLTNGKTYTVGLTATFDGASDVAYQNAEVTPAKPKPVVPSKH